MRALKEKRAAQEQRRPGPAKNDRIIFRITDVNNRGCGVGRLNDAPDGKVIFAAGAVTGEEVSAKVIKTASDYLVARVEERLSDSPHRISPDCPSFPACGGCVYRHIAYEHELSLKEAYVKNAFRKAGLPPVLEPIVFGRPYGYRNKIECPLTEDYRPGFFSPRSHRVVAADDCRLQSPALTPVLHSMTAWLAAHRVPLYREETGEGLLRHVFLRVGETSGEIMAALVINGPRFPEAEAFAASLRAAHPAVVSVILNHNERRDNVILGEKNTVISGRGWWEDSLCGLTFRLSPLSFYQVNAPMAALLYRQALDYAAIRPGEQIADLYCGVGTIGLFFLKNSAASRLVGVEIVPEAVENARINAAQNGLADKAVFLCSDANEKALDRADVVIVDPPRKGCGEALLDRLAAISPRRLVYISCNPDTLARDLSRLRARGFALLSARPFDLFPRTGHVECVCLLSKLKSDQI